MEGIKIRRMQQADILQAHAVALQCFTTPWPVSSFEYELRNSDAILNIAVMGNETVGYICLRSILDVTHILDIAVLPGFRRMGIGSMLLQSALQELRRSKPDVGLVTLEVRESNIAAMKLYEKFGFKEIGRRRDYYKRPLEDAILMELDISSYRPPSILH